MSSLRKMAYITRTGVSMLGLSDAAESIGFRTLGVRIDIRQLVRDVPLPCIIHWNENHFIIVYRVRKSRKEIFVVDPAIGHLKYRYKEFCDFWYNRERNNGYCLILQPTPEFYMAQDEVVNHKQISFLLKYLRNHSNLIWQLVLSFFVAGILQLFIPFLTQSIVDKGINYNDLSFLTLVLIAQLALSIGRAVVELLRGWILLHLTTRINISLISDFLAKLMRLPISFFDSRRTGDLMQRISDNNRIQNFLTNNSLNFLFSLATFIVFSCVIAHYNIKLFSIFILFSSIYIVWVSLFMKYRRKLDKKRFNQSSNNQSNLIQLITGMHEIKLNNCEKKKRWEWERIQARLFEISIKGLVIRQSQSTGALIINGSKDFIITFLTAKSVIDGQITLGMMLSIQYIIGQLNGPIEQLLSFLNGWQDAKLSLERLGEIYEKESEESGGEVFNTDTPSAQGITLKDISFQYEGPNSPFALKDIDIQIPANKITAIVGASGSGKTTLIKLLQGFYPPVDGEIRIGDSLLNTIDVQYWRKNIGSVMQDGFIFSDTILNNIALTEESPNYKRFQYALKVANIDSFVESLPSGNNTQIGFEGTGISQGQKQRILIARVVYKDPRFVFFDEATNALDAKNESIIMENLNQFFMTRTVLIVAHRLSTVKNADKIIVLSEGKIVEEGNHATLTNKKGFYYELVKNQLELGS